MDARTVKMVDMITKYVYCDRVFYIMKDEKGYCWGIEKKNLYKKVNGGIGHRRKTVNDCIQRINDHVNADNLVEQGYSRLVAAIVATGAMSLEDALAREKELKLA